MGNFKYKENYTQPSHIYRPIYSAWHHMKNRCYNLNYDRYKDWGGRGIIVCNEWYYDFEVFLEWALKNGWIKGLSIDRIDNDGHYYPENCRWTIHQIQVTNQRKRKDNTSGYIGIFWRKDNSNWQVQISVNKKTIFIGFCSTKKEAVESRNNYIDLHNLPHKKNIYIGE